LFFVSVISFRWCYIMFDVCDCVVFVWWLFMLCCDVYVLHCLLLTIKQTASKNVLIFFNHLLNGCASRLGPQRHGLLAPMLLRWAGLGESGHDPRGNKRSLTKEYIRNMQTTPTTPQTTVLVNMFRTPPNTKNIKQLKKEKHRGVCVCVLFCFLFLCVCACFFVFVVLVVVVFLFVVLSFVDFVCFSSPTP
jgi:hypothetical protein